MKKHSYLILFLFGILTLHSCKTDKADCDIYGKWGLTENNKRSNLVPPITFNEDGTGYFSPAKSSYNFKWECYGDYRILLSSEDQKIPILKMGLYKYHFEKTDTHLLLKLKPTAAGSKYTLSKKL